jgi:hypothetical protein
MGKDEMTPCYNQYNFLGFRLDVYIGRCQTKLGFRISRPKPDLYIPNEWRVISVRLWPPGIKTYKAGNYSTHT